MKHFIYTKVGKPTNMGGTKVKAQVYEIKKNVPMYVCEVQWNTASFKGEESKIMNHLADIGKINKKYSDGYFRTTDNKDFDIHSV